MAVCLHTDVFLEVHPMATVPVALRGRGRALVALKGVVAVDHTVMDFRGSILVDLVWMAMVVCVCPAHQGRTR